MMRRLLAASILWLVPALGACAPTDLMWTEEVKLHDGKVIQLKRRSELAGGSFTTQSRGQYRYHEFCYTPMGIHWKSKPEYMPEIFDLVDGKAYVRVPLRGCPGCMLHNYPASNSLHFVWDGKTWIKIDEKTFPERLRFNLLNSTHGNDDGSHDARGLVTLVDKERRDSSIYYVLERTRTNGLNERPSVRDMCKKCKGIDVRTTSTADVFLPGGNFTCNW